MKPSKKYISQNRRGAALLLSLVFIVMFSTLAVAMAAMSGTNVQLADNQRRSNVARSCAESGHQIIRNWFSYVNVSGKTPQSQMFSAISNDLSNIAQSISGVSLDLGSGSISVPAVTLESTLNKSFRGTIVPLPSPSDPQTLQVYITGVYGQVTKTIVVRYVLGDRANTVFDFGVASKGPLALSGNIELNGINVDVESNVYIESLDDWLALDICGNSSIAGDVKIVNPDASVSLQGGQASIGGDTGADAIANHVHFGVPPAEFPEPDPTLFEPYAINVVDANTSLPSNGTFENIRIKAGTNPTFANNTTLKGVVYVEQPNVVDFSGSVEITGIIAAAGDVNDDSGQNQLIFRGTVDSYPVSALPADSQYDGIRDLDGTFICAPGFATSFGGNFHTVNGTIASNGVEFFGNAGGTIKGSVINYADDTMTLDGNSDLLFNRSGTTTSPPGFIPRVILLYDPGTYSEPVS